MIRAEGVEDRNPLKSLECLQLHAGAISKGRMFLFHVDVVC